MGEKGNLLDMGEEIFANLAEQGPQFWLDYKQYQLSRAQSAQAPAAAEQQQGAAVVERDAAAQDAPAEQRPAPRPPGRRLGRWPAKAARCWRCSAAAIAV